MAIYELVLTQEYFGQRCINRFNYVSAGSAGSALPAFALVSTLGLAPGQVIDGAFPTGSFARLLQQTQSASASFVSVFCRDLYSNTDFYDAFYVPGTVGVVAGEAMSPTQAYGFLSSRPNLGVRRGTRRFTGVVEAAVLTGGIISAGTLAGLSAIADEMSAVQNYTDDGASLSFTPSVLSREEYETPSGRVAYRKYATEALQLEHIAVGVTWSPYVAVRTQVSRQYGRGT